MSINQEMLGFGCKTFKPSTKKQQISGGGTWQLFYRIYITNSSGKEVKNTTYSSKVEEDCLKAELSPHVLLEIHGIFVTSGEGLGSMLHLKV